MSKIFFGFGHGFGGTHLLAKILNLIPTVNCGHERKDEFSSNALFDKFKEVWYGESDGVSFIEKERRQMVEKIIKSGDSFGEVNGILGFFITPLYKIWPDAKFIYTFRDPRTQVISSHNTGIFNKGILPPDLDPYWWPYPKNNWKIAENWDNMSNLERCAWFWANYNEFVIKQLKNIPEDNIFRIKFEDIISGKKLNELFNFLNINSPEDKVSLNNLLNTKVGETSKRVPNVLPAWRNLDKNFKDNVLSYTSETMKKLGYEVNENE